MKWVKPFVKNTEGSLSFYNFNLMFIRFFSLTKSQDAVNLSNCVDLT